MPPEAARGAMKAMLAAGADLAYDPYTVLVQTHPDVRVDVGQLAADVGGQVYRTFEIVPGLVQVTVGGMTVAEAIERLSQPRYAALVQYAEPDYIVHHTGFPNDTNFASLWGMHQSSDRDIDAPEAWDVWTGDPNFVVAVIDTSIRTNHPDLAANIWVNPGEIANNGVDDDGNGYVDDINGWDFYNNDNNPSSTNNSWDYQHGTHTAGTVGAVGNNGVGVTGVNWRCKIMALQFLGAGGGSTSDAIAALNYARTKGVKVSNNSWGGGGYSASLRSAIENTKSVGHVFVAAAGNSGVNIDVNAFYPAAYDNTNLIAVAATNSADGRPSWSNYGPTRVDLGAPGAHIYSTFNGTYAYGDGTSMACPHVAGVAALVYSKNPGLTYAQVIDQILSTVRTVSSMQNKTVTGGVVNAMDAIGGSPNTPPSITIDSPAYGSTHGVGQPILFSTTTLDGEDGDISNLVTWTSNIDGLIGVGDFTSSTLSEGTHFIDVEVTDSGGLTDYEFLTIGVEAGSVPTAPTALNTLEGAPGVLTHNWTDNSNNETGFGIQRQQKVGGVWTNLTDLGPAGPNSTSFTESVPSGGWRYRVRALGSGGDSAWSGYKPAKAAKPTGMSASVAGGTVNLAWNDNSGIESGYRIQRQQRVGGVWTNTTVIGTVGPNTTSSVDSPGSGEWRYRVQATSLGLASVYSAWSAKVTVP
jgi:subtilisin family serine protease